MSSADIDNLSALLAAIEAAKKVADKPSLIKVGGWVLRLQARAPSARQNCSAAAMTAVYRCVICLPDWSRGLQVKTIIGLGSKKQGTHGVHGSPLGPDDLKHVKTHYGFNPGEH